MAKPGGLSRSLAGRPPETPSRPEIRVYMLHSWRIVAFPGLALTSFDTSSYLRTSVLRMECDGMRPVAIGSRSEIRSEVSWRWPGR
jgi:hypothetical protein